MSSIPGSEYINYDRDNPRWREDNGETGQIDWARDHSIDPLTGELIGDFGYVPWKFGRAYQAEHDRAMWGYRNRLMDQGRGRIADARRFQQGALGLLQSWRPGGGAALESGIYNQVAGGMRAEGAAFFQQARDTQNLDLMSDTRAHDRGEASARANRQFNRAQTTALIGAALGAGISSNASAGMGDTGMPTTQGNNASANVSGGGGGGGGGASGGGGGGGDFAVASTLEPEGGPAGQTSLQEPNQPAQQQQQQQQGSPFGGSMAGGPAQPTKQLDSQFIAQTDPFAQQGQPAVGDQAGGGAGGGAPGAPVAPFPTPGAAGADGNFSPDAFAASAAMGNAMGGPVSAISQIDLNHYLADLIEEDPFYQTLPTFIMNEWRKRQQVGAA
jgi:hypothetical protein